MGNSLATHLFIHETAFGRIIVVACSARIATCNGQRQKSTGSGKNRRATRHKGSELHHQGAFLQDYYTFESSHDGDHDGIVRLFVGLSCELGGFLVYVIDYITLHQVATALLVAGSTPTFWISTSVSIHQLVSKRCSSANLRLVPINAHVT